MRQNQYVFVTLLYIILVFFISQIVTYNVILTNPVIGSYSIIWLLILVYNIAISLIFIKGISNISLNSYVTLAKYVTISSLLSLLFIIFKDLIIVKELSIVTYIKFILTLLLVSIFVSLVYFLEISFRKYRILWIIGFLGTVILSPLLVESGIFVRDLRFKSLLDFWNWIVPYQSIEQLRQFVLFEGWQGWETVLISIIHLSVYWFVIASICLYVRQFQSSWKVT
ncbi:hypothetical protein B0813_000343 [Candidatus Fervidibacteria bacterium JGI MDM2 SSWTFF-3-K9]